VRRNLFQHGQDRRIRLPSEVALQGGVVHHHPGNIVSPFARIGLYRPWVASIDEGWTRWILEQYQFPFTSLYNADVRAGHLREHFDTIVIPDMNERSILEGHRPGTIPERYAGGIGEEGAQELRDFVNQGGTLVAFNNASLFAISQFNLPVTNALAAGQAGQFFCSGCLLTVHIEDAKNRLTAGLPADTIVMFERGPAFDTKTDFKGKVLARYRGDPVLVEQGRHLVSTFHPELTGDPRVHELFLEKL